VEQYEQLLHHAAAGAGEGDDAAELGSAAGSGLRVRRRSNGSGVGEDDDGGAGDEDDDEEEPGFAIDSPAYAAAFAADDGAGYDPASSEDAVRALDMMLGRRRGFGGGSDDLSDAGDSDGDSVDSGDEDMEDDFTIYDIGPSAAEEAMAADSEDGAGAGSSAGLPEFVAMSEGLWPETPGSSGRQRGRGTLPMLAPTFASRPTGLPLSGANQPVQRRWFEHTHASLIPVGRPRTLRI
jgi:hypothetical protein